MARFEIVSEAPVSLSELKEKLKEMEKSRKLSFRAERTKNFLAGITIVKQKEEAELKKKILDLNIPRLREDHAIKIIDIMPKDLDSLKIIFSGSSLTIKDDDLQKILDVIS